MDMNCLTMARTSRDGLSYRRPSFRWSSLLSSAGVCTISQGIGSRTAVHLRYILLKTRGTYTNRSQHIEQFVGSQSVFGAIFTQVRLQLIDATGTTLILLWLVSPLGGQASLRLLSTGSTAPTTSQIGFGNLSNTISQLDVSTVNMFQTTFNGLYTASLVSSLDVKQGPRDPWGNPKMPAFESLSTQADEAGFKAVLDNGETDWASLIGIPITGLHQSARNTATITARYYHIDCWEMYGVDGTTNWPADKLGVIDNNTDIWTSWTGSTASPGQWLTVLNGDWKNGDWPATPRLNMTFASWSGESLYGGYNNSEVFYTANATIANCTIEPSHLDLQLICDGFSCRIAYARRSTAVVRPTGSSDDDSQGTAYWGDMMNEWWAEQTWVVSWNSANAVSNTGMIAPTLFYFAGNEAFPFVTYEPGGDEGGTAPKLYELPLEDVTRRIRRLLNTYRQASMGPLSYNNTIPFGEPEAFLSGKTTSSTGDYDISLSPVDATIEPLAATYKVDAWWLAITIIASCVLLLTGLVGFAAKFACVGPDLLGSFTTVLRVSPYTAPYLAGDNSTLDSGSVAKSNKNLKLELKDVMADQDVGLLAVSAEASGSEKRISDIRRRRKGRLYE